MKKPISMWETATLSPICIEIHFKQLCLASYGKFGQTLNQYDAETPSNQCYYSLATPTNVNSLFCLTSIYLYVFVPLSCVKLLRKVAKFKSIVELSLICLVLVVYRSCKNLGAFLAVHLYLQEEILLLIY